jgi:hypothetical protein
MTRAEQLSLANEISVLCGIVRGYVNSFCPPSDDATTLQVALDQVATAFLELTDELVEDGAPSDLQICPACGENLAAAPLPSSEENEARI